MIILSLNFGGIFVLSPFFWLHLHPLFLGKLSQNHEKISLTQYKVYEIKRTVYNVTIFISYNKLKNK